MQYTVYNAIVVENSSVIPQKVKQKCHDSVILLFGVYLKELRAEAQTDTCMQILITALFSKVERWKQSKWSSINKKLNTI